MGLQRSIVSGFIIETSAMHIIRHQIEHIHVPEINHQYVKSRHLRLFTLYYLPFSGIIHVLSAQFLSFISYFILTKNTVKPTAKLQARRIRCRCLFFLREQQLSALDLRVQMSHEESSKNIYQIKKFKKNLIYFSKNPVK